MAGLGKGHTYDNWHPTKKYFPSPRKEIDFGFEIYQEFHENLTMTYAEFIRKESTTDDRWRKLELEWADYD
jgi:hypothetical protein